MRFLGKEVADSRTTHILLVAYEGAIVPDADDAILIDGCLIDRTIVCNDNLPRRQLGRGTLAVQIAHELGAVAIVFRYQYGQSFHIFMLL